MSVYANIRDHFAYFLSMPRTNDNTTANYDDNCYNNDYYTNYDNDDYYHYNNY